MVDGLWNLIAESRLLQASLIAAAVIIWIPAWRRIFPKESHMQMDWRDYAMYYFCVGVGMMFVGEGLGWSVVSFAGLLMWAPMGFLMFGGLVWFFEDAIRGMFKR